MPALGTILSTTSVALSSDIANQILNGGNSTGAAITIGTNDNFALNFEVNGSQRVIIATNGETTFLNNIIVDDVDLGLYGQGGLIAGYMPTDIGGNAFGDPNETTDSYIGGSNYSSNTKYSSNLITHTIGGNIISTVSSAGVNIPSSNIGFNVPGTGSFYSDGSGDVRLTTSDDVSLLIGALSFAATITFGSGGNNQTNYDSDVHLFAGSLKLTAAGNGFFVKEGSNATMGTGTMIAGAVTVLTTKVTANSRIMLTGQNSSGTPGELTVSARTAGTSFTITSESALDTRLVGWIILEPA